jgi:uncharacterized membrane protein YkvA (DUF1232 family)
MLTRLGAWARNLKTDILALWLAARDPRVPWYAKLVAGMVAAYALSPIDLIPDFVPVLGYVDDLIIVPLGILLAIKLMPGALLNEHRRAARAIGGRPVVGYRLPRSCCLVRRQVPSLRSVGTSRVG